MRPAPLFVALAMLVPARSQDLAGDLTLHRLLINGEGWQVVAEGLGFADAPCADAEGNFYFSDMRETAPGIYRVAPDGQKTKVSDEAVSGLKFGPDGRFYACQGAKKRLFALDRAGGNIEVLAENVEPNDLVVTHRGHVYFTETGKKQVTFLDPKTKELRAVDTGISAPNGLTLSPDQGTLAVSDYRGVHVWTFRVEVDGSLTGKAPTMAMRQPVDPNGHFKFHEGPPLRNEAGGDGMTSDTLGRFFVATSLGSSLRSNRAPVRRPAETAA